MKHDAGYDAFVTGFVFLNLVCIIARGEGWIKGKEKGWAFKNGPQAIPVSKLEKLEKLEEDPLYNSVIKEMKELSLDPLIAKNSFDMCDSDEPKLEKPENDKWVILKGLERIINWDGIGWMQMCTS